MPSVAVTLLSDQVASFFAEDGPLARSLMGYEPRRGQVQFSQAVARALQSERPLLAEAGTGIGKTLAYLVPALLSEKQVLVSTATRALQEQIVHEDVPLLEHALGREISVAMLKGRTNYLCERRAESALATGGDEGMNHAQLLRVQSWRHETDTGDRVELGDLGPEQEALWQRLTATGDQCFGRRCTFYDRCWLVIARNRAEQASISVINHHLYFADAALAQRSGRADERPASLLPPAAAVIFDEAHELDDIAGRHFGAQLSEKGLDHLLEEVLESAMPAGEATLGHLASHAQRAAAAAFSTIAALTPRAYIEQTRAVALGAAVSEGAHPPPPLQEASERLHQRLGVLSDELGKAEQSELNVLGRRVEVAVQSLGIAVGLAAAGQSDMGELVRWVEHGDAGSQLLARPLDVAAPLHAALGRAPGIFVSATLRVDGRFDHQRARLGLDDAEELAVASPYDYAQQASLYLPSHLPLPGQPSFDEEAARCAAELVAASGGGAFVLCTSFRAVRQMHAEVVRHFAGNVLVQQRENKGALLRDFMADGDAVLIATMSFWRGIDVRGSALRLVIIDRIPFSPPSDPLLMARAAKVEAAGGDGFADVQLPQAAILLQQGVGRLIRGHSDHGMVALLDPRLTRRGYGKSLLKSLPECRPISTHAEALAQLRALQAQPRTDGPPVDGSDVEFA